MARELLNKKAMDVIKQVEKQENNEEVLESIDYKRARELLQVLPSEF